MKKLIFILASLLFFKSVRAQMPNAIIQYRVSDKVFTNKTQESDCSVNLSALDKYFKQNLGNDDDMDKAILEPQIKKWKSALEQPEERINPRKACNEASFILELKKELLGCWEY